MLACGQGWIRFYSEILFKGILTLSMADAFPQNDSSDVGSVSVLFSHCKRSFLQLQLATDAKITVRHEERKREKFRSGRSVHCRKMGPVFVSILLTCVFLLVGKIFFNDFVEYVFCAFELVFFSFFYSYYLKIRPFHGVPDFLDILCYDLFGFGVFLDC
ncbi:hypothetical protein STEG23_016820 [Scotinomys teguina]